MQRDARRERARLLAEALLSLKDEKECFAFLSDLMTIKELEELTQRLEVAQLLWRKATYAEIVERTGVSTATISRVNRSFMYGEEGYQLVLKRLEGGDD